MTDDQYEKNKKFALEIIREIEEKLRIYSEEDNNLHIAVILQLTNILISILFGNTIINMKLKKKTEKEIKEKAELLRTLFTNSIDHAMESGNTLFETYKKMKEVDPNK